MQFEAETGSSRSHCKVKWLFKDNVSRDKYFFMACNIKLVLSLTLIRMTKDEKVLAVFKGLLL